MYFEILVEKFFGEKNRKFLSWKNREFFNAKINENSIFRFFDFSIFRFALIFVLEKFQIFSPNFFRSKFQIIFLIEEIIFYFRGFLYELVWSFPIDSPHSGGPYASVIIILLSYMDFYLFFNEYTKDTRYPFPACQIFSSTCLSKVAEIILHVIWIIVKFP